MVAKKQVKKIVNYDFRPPQYNVAYAKSLQKTQKKTTNMRRLGRYFKSLKWKYYVSCFHFRVRMIAILKTISAKNENPVSGKVPVAEQS